LLVSGHGDDQVRRMVTIRHRGTPPISFHPSSAGVYRCCNPDLRANVCPNPKRPKNETFGRPPDASPVPLGRRRAAAQKQPFLISCFARRASGENSGTLKTEHGVLPNEQGFPTARRSSRLREFVSLSRGSCLARTCAIAQVRIFQVAALGKALRGVNADKGPPGWCQFRPEEGE
jgi:hypothetical protein